MPGWTILKFFERKMTKIDSDLTCNIASFFIGLAYLILQYYLLTWLNIRFLLLIISPLTTAVIIYKIKKSYTHKSFFNFNTRNLMSEYGLITICTTLIGSIISALWRFPQPHAVGKFSVCQDMLWQSGNINLLSGVNSFDPRVYQVTLVYHYFNNLLFAIHKILLEQLGLFQNDNLVSFNLLRHYQFFLIGVLMGSSFYLLYKLMFKSDAIAAILSFSSLFILYVDPGGVFNDAFLAHWTLNTNAIGLSMPLFIITNVLLFPYLLNTEKFSIFNMLFALILSVVLNGFKGPIGLVLVSSVAIFPFVELILSRNVGKSKKKKIFTYRLFIAFLLGMGFVFIWFTHLSVGAGNESVFVNLNSTSIIGRYPTFQSILYNFGNHFLLTIGLRIVHFIYFTNGVGFLFICGVVFLLVEIKKEGYTSKFNVLIFSVVTAIVGIIPFYIVEQQGTSQQYFFFAAIPFITVIAAYFVIGFTKLIMNKINLRSKVIFKSFTYLFIILFMFWGVYGSGRLQNTSSMRNNNPLTVMLNFSNEELLSYPQAQISSYEFQATQWLFNNTETDSLIATNRQEVAPGDYRFHYFSTFSNRNFLLEGFRYAANGAFCFEEGLELLQINNQLFMENYFDKHTLAVDLGVNYLLISRFSEYNYAPNEDGFSLVFENRDVKIYKILTEL